ncbi:MAG: LacI family DNA-binding transcriptional regulator [Lentisphaeria bacterium]|nr:LacI family DNA-binding transcriptional regulator [Lentisphaeria bacterium]MBQ9775074.1 LacI family DNA-binding transcriptional regulator [Lentisphaeria bacterium]
MKHLAEIARQANCSIATVSRVLNNQPRISEATRKRVMDIAKQMQYKGSRKTRTAAIILPEMNYFQHYSVLLQEACAEELQRNGFKRLIIYQNDIRLLTERYISGAIALTPFGTISRKWSRFHSQPLVCINDYSNLLNGISNAVSDEEQAAQTIFAELQRLKVTKAAIVYWAEETLCTQNRLAAARKYAALTRCELLPITADTKNINSSLQEKIPDDCGAVIISGEITLPAALNNAFFSAKKLFVWQYPGEQPTAENLVTLSQDLPQLAAEAVRMLIEKIADPQAEARHVVVPYQFFGLPQKQLN